MSAYTKGRAFEYKVKRDLEGRGYMVFRTAGSHSPADLIAMRPGEVLLIQCKLHGTMPAAARAELAAIAARLGVSAALVSGSGRKLSIEYIHGSPS